MTKKLPKTLQPVKHRIEELARVRTRLTSALARAKYVHENRDSLLTKAFEEGVPGDRSAFNEAALSVQDIANELRALAQTLEDASYNMLATDVKEW